MNRKVLFFLVPLLPFLLFCSCKLSSSDRCSENVSTGDLKIISVSGSFDALLQVDILFDSIQVIPLETKEECLIEKPCRITFHDNKIYVQDFIKHLYQFDCEGNFVQEIGTQGRGPGEFLQVSGFDFDEQGNIYVLDMTKILKYSPKGEFLKSIPIQLGVECYPDQIICDGENGFYLWGGTNSIFHNKQGNRFAMYQMDANGNLRSSYFPLKYKIANNLHRFRKYGNYHNIDPVFGNDTIYRVDETGVVPNYFIDFGKNVISKPIPQSFISLGNFKEEFSRSSAFDISNFTENDEWVYFHFTMNHRYVNVYYSKVLNKVYVSSPNRNAPFLKSMLWQMDVSWGDRLVSLLQPGFIKQQLISLEQSQRANSLSAEDRILVDQLRGVSLSDNPILLVCRMKKYY